MLNHIDVDLFAPSCQISSPERTPLPSVPFGFLSCPEHPLPLCHFPYLSWGSLRPSKRPYSKALTGVHSALRTCPEMSEQARERMEHVVLR